MKRIFCILLLTIAIVSVVLIAIFSSETNRNPQSIPTPTQNSIPTAETPAYDQQLRKTADILASAKTDWTEAFESNSISIQVACTSALRIKKITTMIEGKTKNMEPRNIMFPGSAFYCFFTNG